MSTYSDKREIDKLKQDILDKLEIIMQEIIELKQQRKRKRDDSQEESV